MRPRPHAHSHSRLPAEPELNVKLLTNH
ncbi:hypothetical protein VARIO8X_130133 [Burkholderiales bacterium 8X]|nr:hypothetical protein VARIO8X_130133 [Burkholderiales bacterium 8X]